MKFCGKCGAPMEDNVKFCPGCGAPVEEQRQEPPAQDYGAPQQNYSAPAPAPTAVKDDAQEGKLMSVLSYLSFLVLIPFFTVKDNPFVRFHTGQGLTLFAIEFATSIIMGILNWILPYGLVWRLVNGAYGLLGIGFFVLGIIGIMNAVNGKEAELPLIGGIRLIK